MLLKKQKRKHHCKSDKSTLHIADNLIVVPGLLFVATKVSATLQSKHNTVQWIEGGGKEEAALFLSWVAFKTVEAYELVSKMIPVTEHVAPCLACLERIQFGFSRLTGFFFWVLTEHQESHTGTLHYSRLTKQYSSAWLQMGRCLAWYFEILVF